MGASALLRDRTTVGGAAAQRRSAPSYATLRRFLKANGLDKRRRVTLRQTAGADRAEARLLDREVRSYEAAYVNGLWHWDCHHGSRKVLTARGEWQTPILFGVLDDRSRLACHLQWYLAETAEIVAHGLSQAFQKRGLPRSGLSDNGPAMTAAEITEGLRRLGILHHTTLPYSPYQNAKQEAEGAFGGDIDYAQLVKLYGSAPESAKGRYSPGECIGARKERIEGNPDPAHISTSYAERQNLTMRMQMRRFTRLTNAFSKKFENHMHTVALYTVWYNFVKLHKAHRMTPAMAAGVSDRLWSMEDIAALVEAAAPKPGPRGPYKKQPAVISN